MKKYILAFIFLFTLFVPNVVLAQKVGDKPLLYVREGCPHCAKVKAFLSKHNLNNYVVEIETYNDEAKTAEMQEWFTKLNVTDPNQRGVPFLVVDDSTYLVGDQPIINYIAEKNNITIEAEEYQSSTSDTIFMIIGGLVMFGVLGYGVASSFKKKD